MSGLKDREIMERLRSGGARPPAGLKQRLLDDIPRDVFGAGSDSPPVETVSRTPRSSILALAAVLVVAVGAALSWRLLSPTENDGERLAETVYKDEAVFEEERSQPVSAPVVEQTFSESVRSRDDGTVVDGGRVAENDEARNAAGDRAPGSQPRELDVPNAAPRDRFGSNERQVTAAQRDLSSSEQQMRRALEDRALAPERAATPPREEQTAALVAAEERSSRPVAVAGVAEAPVPASESRSLVATDALFDLRSRVVQPDSAARADSPPVVRSARDAASPSTGGTAEPNDQAFGDMFFDSAGVHPFIDTDDDRLSTFGLDVDTGSFTVARAYLEVGALPPPEAIRVEEFLNYFDYGDAAPHRGDFALSVDGGPSRFGEGPDYRLLRFGIAAREVAAERRSPAMLVFLVDVSGSMGQPPPSVARWSPDGKRLTGGESRIAQVRQGLTTMLDHLQSSDRIGVVVYSDRGRVLLEPDDDVEAVRDAIARLRTGGSTNLQEGLQMAYELAAAYARPGTINRIILCSDGVANVGDTSAEAILDSVDAGLRLGIEISTVGFGLGNYNDALMEKLADRGNGNYAYVDSSREAQRVFVENLTGMLQTIATDAKVQVDFDPQAVSRYRLLGYENRQVADRRFRDDSVDAGEIGAGHRVTALYEIKLHPDVRRADRLATLRLRYRSSASGAVEELEQTVTAADLAVDWRAASPALRLATVVGELGELLRGTYWARGSSFEDVLEALQEGPAMALGAAQAEELERLVRIAVRVSDNAKGNRGTTAEDVERSPGDLTREIQEQIEELERQKAKHEAIVRELEEERRRLQEADAQGRPRRRD